jgi:hypothetical protein
MYIVLIIIILAVLLEGNIERFTNRTDVLPSPSTVTSETTSRNSNSVNMVKPIHSLIVSLDDPNLYIGSYITYTGGDHLDNFLYTSSLLSNQWLKPTENLSLDNEHIIIDLTYDFNRRLTAIGLKMNKNNEPEYGIFKKKTSDFKSGWTEVDSNKKIRCLLYDLEGQNLLGISSYDGQVYETKNNLLSFGDWKGPINFDLPMRKIMFDKEGFMIGISLVDNFIYKKKDKDWRQSKWDRKNTNKTPVFDLVYDKDGCFIAATKEGIKKQKFPDFGSEFVFIKDFDQEHDDILEHSEIIKYKTGYDFLEEEFDLSTELGRDLKRIYDFKKISKDLCKNKGRFKRDTLNPEKETIDNNVLNKQNDEINDLYDKINDLTNKLGV